MVEIVQLKESSEQAVADISNLLRQLREDPAEHQASVKELKEITDDKNVVCVVAKEEGHIVGMATLYMITKFSKRVGFIEDVVVDSGQRGKGLGQKIMEHLIAIARTEKIKTLHLTSRPERTAGNALYQKLGFEIKQTNPYRLKL